MVPAVAGSSPVAHPSFYSRVMNKLFFVPTVAVVSLAAGCSGPFDHSSHMASQSTGMTMNHAQMGPGSGAEHPTDPMFTAQMIPHHQAAIDMAALAATRAEHPEIKQLAADIASGQASEIALMKRVGKANKWDPNAKMQHSGSEGMSTSEMGMDMDVSKLKSAKPFDKAFIEMMVPHPEGAILMANHELARGSNSEIRALGRRIIRSQSAQMKQMRTWYRTWYHHQLP